MKANNDARSSEQYADTGRRQMNPNSRAQHRVRATVTARDKPSVINPTDATGVTGSADSTDVTATGERSETAAVFMMRSAIYFLSGLPLYLRP